MEFLKYYFKMCIFKWGFSNGNFKLGLKRGISKGILKGILTRIINGEI